MSHSDQRCPLSPQQLVDIEFKDLNYKVTLGRNEHKIILKNISGKFKSRELTGVIGSSGSGKTTLLNVLAGYKCNGSSGTILMNSVTRNVEKFRKLSRYIMQDYSLFLLFTVQEAMMIAANLKLGQSSYEHKIKIIDDILISLDMDGSRNTRTDKLSGGEKKRLSIGLELVDNPSVLILDEPTTGLDEYSCTQCISFLKELAMKGRTVICSLHTPSARVLSFIDRTYVVSSGRCAFQGGSSLIVPYLASIDLNCPDNYNPADFIIEVCNGDCGDYEEILAAMTENGKLIFNDEYYEKKSIISNEEPEIYEPMEYGANWTTQFRILTIRMWSQIWRDKTLFIMKFISILVASLLLGLLYQGNGHDASKTVEMYIGLSGLLIFFIYYYGVPAIYEFPNDLKCSSREYFNGWYNISAYYCALSVSKLHLHLGFGIIYSFIIYVMQDHPMEVKRFSITTCVLILTGLIAESMAHLTATLFKLLNAFNIFMYIFAILIIVQIYDWGIPEAPVWIQIIMYSSFLRYGFNGLISGIYEGRARLECEVEFCYYPNLDRFAREFASGIIPWWIDVIALIVIFTLLKIVGYYVLKAKLNK